MKEFELNSKIFQMHGFGSMSYPDYAYFEHYKFFGNSYAICFYSRKEKTLLYRFSRMHYRIGMDAVDKSSYCIYCEEITDILRRTNYKFYELNPPENFYRGR